MSHRNRAWALSLAFAALVGLAMTSCGIIGGQSDEPVKVGAVFDFTGELS